MEQKKLKNNRLDLAGQQYGILTVMQSSENIGIRTAWLCQCDCGSTTIVKTVDLRRGKVTSCGCRKKPMGCCRCNISMEPVLKCSKVLKYEATIKVAIRVYFTTPNQVNGVQKSCFRENGTASAALIILLML